MLSGKWTYRSYHNRSDLIAGDAEKALKNIFGEGVFEFTPETYVRFGGFFDMGGEYRMELEATLVPFEGTRSAEISIIARGIAGTPTEGWQYDYRATFGHRWDNGLDQVPSFVGTVIRVKPHGAAPAGYVASFIAVRQSD